VQSLAEALRLAEEEDCEARIWADSVEFCQRAANALQLEGSTPKEVLDALVDLRGRAREAQLQVQKATKDEEDLRNAGFSGREADSLSSQTARFFESEMSNITADAVAIERQRQLEALDNARAALEDCRRNIDSLAQSMEEVSRSVGLGGWATRVPRLGSFASLIALQHEFRSITSNVDRLRSYMEVGDDVLLVEVQARVAAVASAFKQAYEASRSDLEASTEQRELPIKIEDLRLILGKARDEEKALHEAADVLDDLLKNASLESATRHALDAIGDQINEVFSRIHSPREYMYVGRPNVLLQTVDSREARSLDQVSTGQRAAFALSVFLARHRTATSAPSVLLIDDPIAHVDDLNALSFLDYLRDLAVNSGRQIFFSTADSRVASLFSKKFSFMGEAFKTISLVRDPHLDEASPQS
jgi:chromosome segregation protein